ncbi:MAG: transcriptional regulator GcvA [Rhodospirillales bacterium]|nr:transcriptional regulator GcvA [Rhodospirillales bacterium]
MPYRLPPLNTMRLFEAAGRHSSFKVAAEELNLTPSAISHGVQTLEQWLGVDLFLRGNRTLALTAAGEAYLPRVRAALEAIVEASDAVPGRKPTGRLAVSVSPTFGVRWLLPRLARFNDRHPDIEVSVDTNHRLVDFPRDGIDVAIRMGRGDWAGLDIACLVREQLVPVCAPRVAAAFRSTDDLADTTLLHVVDAREDWTAWSRLAGIALPPAIRGLRFDTIQMALEAAAAGLGIAIGRLPLVEAELAAGRLVPVFGPPRTCRTGYWMVTARGSRIRPEIAAFCDWIEGEVEPSLHVSGTPVSRRGRVGRIGSMVA